jgi:hypothetical protein
MQTENARLVHEVHQLSSLIRNQQSPFGTTDHHRQIAGRALGPTSPTTYTPPSYDNQPYLPPFRDSLYQAGGHSIPDRHMGFIPLPTWRRRSKT